VGGELLLLQWGDAWDCLWARSGNPVSSVMVSWMYNNAKDVKTEIDNTLRVSASLSPFSLNWKTITRKARKTR